MSDLHHGIIITWPKIRSLDSYLNEVTRAKEEAKLLFYRIRGFPVIAYGAPCYHVHDGEIRGWMPTLGVHDVEAGIIEDPITHEYWPAGIYLIRSPDWHQANWTSHDPASWKMQGFRGWRYYDRAVSYA